MDDRPDPRSIPHDGQKTNDTSLPTDANQAIGLYGKSGLQAYPSPVEVDPEEVNISPGRVVLSTGKSRGEKGPRSLLVRFRSADANRVRRRRKEQHIQT